MSQRKEKQKRRVLRAQQTQKSEPFYPQTLFEGDAQKQESFPPFSSPPERPPGNTHVPSSAPGFHPLQIALEPAVVLYVMEFFERGGPAAWEVEEARSFGHVLASKGDTLLYRGRRQGETADLFDGLAKSVAVLAHSPGGVPLWGKHLDAEKIVAGLVGAESARAYIRESVERYYRERVTEIQAEIFLLPSRSLGTWDVIRWFQHASDADLLQLRAERYSNALPDGTIKVNAMAEGVVASLLEVAERRIKWSPREQRVTDENREKVVQAQQLIQARDEGRSILCHIDSTHAESWLSIFKHALLQKNKKESREKVGERKELPHACRPSV